MSASKRILVGSEMSVQSQAFNSIAIKSSALSRASGNMKADGLSLRNLTISGTGLTTAQNHASCITLCAVGLFVWEEPHSIFAGCGVVGSWCQGTLMFMQETWQRWAKDEKFGASRLEASTLVSEPLLFSATILVLRVWPVQASLSVLIDAEVMGPTDPAMSLTNSITVTTITKLSKDLSNWPIYKDRVKTAIESKVGLSQHLAGASQQPTEPALPPADAKTEVINAYDKAPFNKMALYSQGGFKKGKGKRGKKANESLSGKKCNNYGLTNHIAADCFRPGGGKEGQWLASMHRPGEHKKAHNAGSGNIAFVEEDDPKFGFLASFDFNC
ncbi:hypothetical protein HETIRDRAFT_430186 [Heterobasidion irregulare TC 32-1]|uniref:Uncharacterized protein n=1 Tax=Heterobasidion irregulare (strain TC 32-1) TaxID=747525 RepID=W4JTR1_HETIT|nr:uncharacterized protein HETIRDRAFT_430186 [Heterobasidion irregulare TC 32-1]ETW76928.1 hypothetical protein HETIRDRAFT_430186 [Heterobasidion irregulare TC 32-1]